MVDQWNGVRDTYAVYHFLYKEKQAAGQHSLRMHIICGRLCYVWTASEHGYIHLCRHNMDLRRDTHSHRFRCLYRRTVTCHPQRQAHKSVRIRSRRWQMLRTGDLRLHGHILFIHIHLDDHRRHMPGDFTDNCDTAQTRIMEVLI